MAPSKPHKRKGKSSLRLDLGNAVERPAVSALFVVHFDVKAGYTISWKRCADELELSNSVEFKSLPSGLHNVEEDLVYFVHEEQYAGISAFVNNSGAKHERGALMLAVGALIPLEHGRLGRSWRHADMLKELARQLVKDPELTGPLEEYWQLHGIQSEEPNGDNDLDKPSKETDTPVRPSLEESAQAQAKSLMPGPTNELSMFHPARSMPTMLETFGPLIYPLYKAALLRKRILFVIEAPVELACNFVYNVSILSNIPASLANVVPLDPLPVRLQPLFSIGVHDIDALAARNKRDSQVSGGQLNEGWVACTTDDVLCHKKDLYDIMVTLPAANDKSMSKSWPTLRTSGELDLKANQRDVRRYRNLRKGVERRDAILTPVAAQDDETADDTDGDEEPLLRQQSQQEILRAHSDPVEIDEKLVEPVTWSALAYSSFLWWASAGEKGAELDEETERDQAMFQAFEPYTDSLGRSASLRGSGVIMTDGSPSAPEMGTIAYFHRVTTTLFEHLSNLVDDSEEDEAAERRSFTNDPDEIPDVVVEGEDLVRMGLDPWNRSDREFVAQLLDFYWGRKADVRGGRIECCGVRIC